MTKKRRLFLISIILLATAVLRLHQFDYTLCSDDELFHSIYDDERKILSTTLSLNLAEGILGPPTFDYPALGFYAYRGALEAAHLFGIIPPLDSVRELQVSPDELRRVYLVGRYLFFALGLVLVFTVYKVTLRMFGSTESILAAAFMAFLPANVLVGRIIRFHSFACIFMVLLFYYCWRAWREDETESYIIAGVMLALSMSVMYVALPAGILPLVAKWMHNKPSGLKSIRATVFDKKLWIGYATALGVFCLTSTFVFINLAKTGFSWLGDVNRAYSEKFFIDPLTEGVGYYFYGLLPYAFGPLFLILVIFGTYKLIERKSRETPLLIAVIVALIGVQVVFLSSRLLIRHTSWYTSFISILAAVAGVELIKHSSGFYKAVAWVLVVGALIWNVFFSIQYVRWQSQTWVQITSSRWLAERISPAQPIATIDDFKELYPFIINPEYYIGDFRRTDDVVDVRSNMQKLLDSKAQYFIVTEWELFGLRDKYLRKPERYPENYPFYEKMESGKFFKRIAVFGNPPPWPRFFYGARLVPRDIKLFGQKIFIYERN